jgi:acyl-CoA synthetase (NDP forming)
MLGSAVPETYERAVPPVLRDPGIDAVIVLFVPPVVAGAEDVSEAIARGIEAAAVTDKPVLASVISANGLPEGLRTSRASAFAFPEAAARALGRIADRAEWLRRRQGQIPVLAGIDTAAARRIVQEAGERWLTPAEARELLSAYGIPLVPERAAQTVDEAVAAADELGYPVVVKTAVPGVHKTERGGVALDLRDEAAVREAADRIGPPFIVQPLVRGGVELLVGAVEDPVFGPLVAVGPGGTMAELIGNAGFRLAPLTDMDADELVHGGKAGRLLSGFRGAPPADTGAVADLLLRISSLADDFDSIAELDLNPVIAKPDGCVVVDARVRVAPPARVTSAKTW